jgi:hypothetical protein
LLEQDCFDVSHDIVPINSRSVEAPSARNEVAETVLGAEAVRPPFPIKPVAARTSADDVVSPIPLKVVAAGTAADEVVSRSSDDEISSRFAEDGVAAGTARKGVGAISSKQSSTTSRANGEVIVPVVSFKAHRSQVLQGHRSAVVQIIEECNYGIDSSARGLMVADLNTRRLGGDHRFRIDERDNTPRLAHSEIVCFPEGCGVNGARKLMVDEDNAA